ncbi:MAG: hypothetical protein ABIO94_11485 [Opitutaceae bacterium]
MHHRPIQLNLALPAADYAAYAGAVAILTRVMGSKAPDVLVLIMHSLRSRDPHGLAEDFLDAIGWLPTRRGVSRRKGAIRSAPVLRRALLKSTRAPKDPGRN